MMEPVLVTAVVAALLLLLVEFNVPLTGGQIDAIQGLIVAGAALFARSKVSSNRYLRNNDK